MRALFVIATSFLLSVEPATSQSVIFQSGLENGSTSSWTHDNTLCPTFLGGRTLSSHCYTRLSNPGNWFESRELCQQWAPGGQLVSVETASEWGQILLGLEIDDADAWLGLSRGHGGTCPGAWAWESGSNLTFSYWHPAAPDENSCPTCVAALQALEHRWDDLPCDSAGEISETICEVDLDGVRIVGKNGGRLVFPDGLILEVPAEALDQNTAIGLRSIDCAEVDPLLNARPLNSHHKECLAGFDLTPSDLAFARPVKLILPYAHREADQVPVLLEIFPEESDYAYRPTDVLHVPAHESLELQIAVAGQYAVVELDQSLSPLPTQAPDDKTPELLCEEGRIHVQSDFVDLDVKYKDVECTLVFDSVKVTFLDCAGAPEFEHEMAESVGCSDETYFLGRICGPGVSGDQCFGEPQPVTYVAAEDIVELHNWIQAYDPEQGHRALFIANIDHATYEWQSLDYSMGKFPDPGDSTLQTEECPQETCRFGVQALNRYVSSPLPKGTVEVVSTIFDVEWQYSWDGDQSCSWSDENGYGNIRERYTGGWVGTATFLVPDYLESAVLSYEPEGAIQYRRDMEWNVFCDEPTRVESGIGADQQTWYPEIPCTQYDAELEILENEEQANFWSCIPLRHEFYEYRSGRICSGAHNIDRTSWQEGVPCVFPLWVELTHQGDGIFEADEILLLEPTCSPHACTTQVPVSVFVRAVYRQSQP